MKKELLLSVDYGQFWPLSDIFWDNSDKPDWHNLISPELHSRLVAWSLYFNEHANEETGMFGSESSRKWFDLEGVSLYNKLKEEVGDLFELKLKLWF